MSKALKNLRQDGCYYVDKTALIQDLVRRGRYYFLSRPRRFGKSLLVDTIKCLFEGRKELFEGLAIDDSWNWAKNKHPVVRISFDGKYKDWKDIEKKLLVQFAMLEEKYQFQFPPSVPNAAPEKMIYTLFHLHQKTGKKVVVLIDEYDNPILSQIVNRDQAQENSDYLKDFYGTLKGCQSGYSF